MSAVSGSRGWSPLVRIAEELDVNVDDLVAAESHSVEAALRIVARALSPRREVPAAGGSREWGSAVKQILSHHRYEQLKALAADFIEDYALCYPLEPFEIAAVVGTCMSPSTPDGLLQRHRSAPRMTDSRWRFCQRVARVSDSLEWGETVPATALHAHA